MGVFSELAIAPATRRGAAIELGLLAAAGLFLALIGPYGSDHVPFGLRLVYWLSSIIGGGGIGIAADAALRPRLPRQWLRVLIVSLAITPVVTLLVQLLDHVLLGYSVYTLAIYRELLWRVFVIALPMMGLRSLVLHRPRPVIETRTIVAPPLPEAEAVFRRRLTAPRRAARLIAVEAHDHYLRVHTDAGVELVTLRFADAMAELAGAHGLQVHRSWWVAADAIEGVRWRRGTGELRLASGLATPVSRSHAPALKEAGWF